MYANILLFLILFCGCFMVLTGFFPRASAAAERAVSARSGKKPNSTEILVNKIAVKLLPFIVLEDMKRHKLQQTLITLNQTDSPELFHARAWGTGIVYFSGILVMTPVFQLVFTVLLPGLISGATVWQLNALLAVILLFVGRNAVLSELDTKMKRRREAIEWELPQFSGTVLQSLQHTRNVVDILESYKKICGASLRTEIEWTLNDMRTGNHEQAIKNLAVRINSGAFTQLAQGLIGLLRGDDQASYFQIITKDFNNMQKELTRKELLKRPGKLTINNVMLLAAMMAMFFVAIGSYLMDASSGLF